MLSVLVPVAVCAQALAPAPTATPPGQEEAVQLSPFEVSANTDRGYQPTAVLQGGRGRIDLADVAGQVAVFTKEFMEDIGATTADEAFLFSTSTQTYYDFVAGNDDNRPGTRATPTEATNSRGLGPLDRTRNFFRTSIEPDSYNTERLSLVSGANAVQFGLGGAAGTAESTSARANLSRNRQRMQLRTDSYGTQRGVLDVSQIIVKNRLAFRAIGLREDKEYFLRPGYEEGRRGFLTTTYQPFKNTTIRVEGEYFFRKDNRSATPMTRDNGYMPWLLNPLVYENRTATASTTGRPPAPRYTLIDGTVRNYSFSTKQNLFVWPQNSVPAFSGLQDVRNTVVISVGDNTGGATAQSFRPPGYPWNVNPMGFSRYAQRLSRNLQATVEQRFGRHTVLEVGGSWEAYRNQTSQLFAHNGFDMLVDINKYLPDGATLNPLYGRPFVESNNAPGQGNWSDYYFKQLRATLAHELDLTRNSGWVRYLGRHQVGLFASFDDTAEYFLGNNRFMIIGTPSFLSAVAKANPLHADRAFHMRYYLPPLGSTRDPFAYAIPAPIEYGDIMGVMTFKTPAGEAFQVTKFMNPVGFVGTAPRLSHLQRLSGAASTSSSFLRNHVVVNLGVRHDQVRNADFSGFQPMLTENPPTAANPAGSGLTAYRDFRQEAPPDVWTPYRKATRTNYGIIVRPPWFGRWLSFGYDYSRNASLNEVAIVRDVTGAEVEPAYGESFEYSVRLRLLNDRLVMKVNYFNALNRNTALGDGGLRQNLINFEQQLYRNDPAYPINPLLREENRPVPGDFRLPGDRNSKGLEVDLTFNPSNNWRVFWNLGRTDTETDDISTQPWWDYLAAKLPVWRNYKGNWATAVYEGGQTVQSAHDTMIDAAFDTVQASLGAVGSNAQTWRSSLVVTHLVTEGRLKGASASVNFRYRGPSIVGFANRTDDRGIVRADRDQPYKSDDFLLTGVMASYRFRGFGHTAWRVQANANNIFNTARLYLTRTFADGSPRSYGRQAGREFILSVEVEH
jgi:hypothetical protein